MISFRNIDEFQTELGERCIHNRHSKIKDTRPMKVDMKVGITTMQTSCKRAEREGERDGEIWSYPRLSKTLRSCTVPKVSEVLHRCSLLTFHPFSLFRCPSTVHTFPPFPLVIPHSRHTVQTALRKKPNLSSGGCVNSTRWLTVYPQRNHRLGCHLSIRW